MEAEIGIQALEQISRRPYRERMRVEIIDDEPERPIAGGRLHGSYERRQQPITQPGLGRGICLAGIRKSLYHRHRRR